MRSESPQNCCESPEVWLRLMQGAKFRGSNVEMMACSRLVYPVVG